MASSRRSSGTPDLPAVFTDRCLGNEQVPEGLRAAGFKVDTMAEMYGNAKAQALDDPVWIREMSELGLVLFSKDARIRSSHLDAVIAAEARVFLLPDQHGARARDMIARYVNARFAIAERSRKRGPFVYMVGPRRLDKVRMPPKYPSKADGPASAAARAVAVAPR